MKPRERNPLLTPAVLKAWRLKQGWSHGEVARRLHVQRPTWSQWEHGLRQPPWYLGLALNWLEWDGRIRPQTSQPSAAPAWKPRSEPAPPEG